MVAIRQRIFDQIASDSSYTSEELAEAAEALHDVIQARLPKHFERSRLSGGQDYWLFDYPDGAWLAFTAFDLAKHLRDAEVEVEDQLLYAVANAFLEEFQRRDMTLSIPGAVGRSLEDPVFFPIYVSYPENWDTGEYHTLQRFQELVSRYDMTPAEALDYWATARMNEDAISWAGKRDIDPEGVRKNVRQAKEKLQDEELGAAHEEEDIRAISLNDVPQSAFPEDDDDAPFYDREKDRHYTPTLEQIDKFDLGEDPE